MVWLLNGVGVCMIICALVTVQNSTKAGRVKLPSMLIIRSTKTYVDDKLSFFRLPSKDRNFLRE
jgi:hypothetical protein